MSARLIEGDVMAGLRQIEPGSVRCCVTSPPYWGLRDYGHAGQIGLERTPDEYVRRLVMVFRSVRDTLAADGTLWLNLGDSYYRDPGKGNRAEYLGLDKNIAASGCHNASQARTIPEGFKPKDLVGIPWRVAFALQADGWWLRSDIVWHKPNPMPESVTDRPTKAHEYLFLLSKSERYFYDADAIREPHVTLTDPKYATLSKDVIHWKDRPNNGDGHKVGFGHMGFSDGGRNRRSVWSITTQPFPGAHFAVMPEALVEPCILAGSAPGDMVLDPFAGSGTVGVVALRHGRRFVGCELNPEYVRMARQRISGPLFAQEHTA